MIVQLPARLEVNRTTDYAAFLDLAILINLLSVLSLHAFDLTLGIWIIPTI